jgi:hypothetical protein
MNDIVFHDSSSMTAFQPHCSAGRRKNGCATGWSVPRDAVPFEDCDRLGQRVSKGVSGTFQMRLRLNHAPRLSQRPFAGCLNQARDRGGVVGVIRATGAVLPHGVRINPQRVVDRCRQILRSLLRFLRIAAVAI